MADESDFKTLIPTFIIHLNGNKFTNEQQASVKQVVIEERIDAPSRFSMMLSDPTREWTDSEDMSVGSEVKIQMGYKDAVEEILYGEVLGMSAQYKSQTDPVVFVKGMNHLHRLCRGKKTRSFNEMTDVDIIKQIAGECSLKDEIDNIGLQHLFTMQHNETNYDYIMNMARKYDCRVWAKDKKLFFGKSTDSSSEELVLEYGKTLTEFDVETDTTHILTEIEVRGWNNEKGEAVKGKATIDDISQKVGGTTFGGKYVKDKFGVAKHIYIDDNVLDQSGADKLAADIISLNAMGFITGSGSTEGNNKIRAGSMLELKELGGRFSGKYMVTSVRHVLDAFKGYKTYFKVCRNTD